MSEYVLITGGALNIGASITQRAIEDGLTPIVLDIAAPEMSGVEFHQVDLLDRTATEAVLAKVTEGRKINRLVNNVGIVKPSLLADLDFDDFDTIMHLNLRSAMLCAKAVLPAMRADGFGRIVNTASRTVLGKERRTFYASSKAALVGLARTWAIELGPLGITANVVAPGTIGTTAFFRNNPADEPETQAIIDAIPAGRIGTGKDVSNAVSFFLQEQAGFVNGQVLYVCGGLTAGRAPV
ncbi:3-oxoacyl-[acyl-carrier-protein] reductase FabG1 [Roseovarius gaetbuli]|uniref:3-oxoacyl-[acyl-carrier-protein] reductase FabG1 n=1 Tax=Roseovarius gaetbuli TaxID=1356575 RepID=A0A1X7A7M3_9RHOB|nr:SDR family oxidoreductase [Roseovarius gaetbuli]SLN72303.1 3-oxoacyl-[acyl-carrier-protein] reductase FabG1 [Roseovarius gaetbuli]